ncbi:MAG: agmatinase [Marine Group II euryarchaeote MED-G38]|nr:agmatinase [Euryarchaeota archaeon]OUV25558.1 MAG: agmatinase [Euryarchaeota archaeon TMED97]PDH23782.1 MAG: agmatinase [Marine Group II euryarchaeote MED-G38]|tara:strand:+ start:74403 stop:75320 length:918 start_codon:yes stop_codon:yes gene_type:complete
MKDLQRPRFLGLEEEEKGPYDLVILPIPFEMTVSWNEGTSNGPNSCIEVSSQVELYDPLLNSEIPCGLSFHTAEEWSSEEPTLRKQLDSIQKYIKPWINGEQFPIVLGGEHGILLPIIEVLNEHPEVENLNQVTIIQIDAHADLRDTLNGEKFSHGTVIKRCLDAGVGKVIQIGIRAYSEEEAKIIDTDDRIETWHARDILGVIERDTGWPKLMERITQIEGHVWLTFDIDGLDAGIVPSTGTPVPGGLSYWAAIEIIEKIFTTNSAKVIGSDINEILPGGENGLTQFNAALITTKIIACHISTL